MVLKLSCQLYFKIISKKNTALPLSKAVDGRAVSSEGKPSFREADIPIVPHQKLPFF